MLQFKPVPGHPDYIAVSDGAVLARRPSHGCHNSKKRRHPWRQIAFKYRSRTTWIKLDRKYYVLPRLLLTIFVGPPPPNHYAHHINRDSDDHRIENLEWRPIIGVGTEAPKGFEEEIARRMEEVRAEALRKKRLSGRKIRQPAILDIS